MNSTGDVISNHLNSFKNNDLEAVMSDYTNESILVTADVTYKGLKEIKAFFSTLIPHFPMKTTRFELKKLTVIDRLAFIVWNAKTPNVEVPLGTDTFVLKDGKISQQTFAGTLNYINQ